MEPSTHKINYYFIKTAGLLSIFAGILSLSAVFYVVVVLNHLGLSISIFEDTKALLKWIYMNQLAYSILWLHYAVAATIMIPVPGATSHLFRSSSGRSSSFAKASNLIGSCGFFLMIISAIIFYSVSPITSRAFANGLAQTEFINEIFASLAMQFRLYGEFLVGIWLLGVSVYQIRKNRIDMLGWFLLFIFSVCSIVSIAKSFNLFDFEPFLGILLAIAYIWLGISIRKKIN